MNEYECISIKSVSIKVLAYDHEDAGIAATKVVTEDDFIGLVNLTKGLADEARPKKEKVLKVPEPIILSIR